MTERLTVNASSGLIHLIDNSENGMNHAIQKLSEYETAEEDGRLVVLPCKIGTIVFVIRQSWNGYNIDKKKFTYGMIGKFGKTVFLTKEKAEKALKGVKNEERGFS